MLKRLAAHFLDKLVYDGYVISYPKCGRTWLNAILLHYVVKHYKRASAALPFRWDYPMLKYTWFRRFPTICFTHDIAQPAISYKEYPIKFNVSRYIVAQSVFLVRDPRDVVVSYYYHAKKKIPEKNTKLSPDITLSDFLRHDAYGIKTTVTYYNLWAPVIRKYDNVTLCRYEELYADTKGTVKRILEFFGVSCVDIKALEWAIEKNTFENLQKREIQKKRLNEREIDKNKLRVRRGIIGGYLDTLIEKDIQYINSILSKYLDSLYGYS